MEKMVDMQLSAAERLTQWKCRVMCPTPLMGR